MDELEPQHGFRRFNQHTAARNGRFPLQLRIRGSGVRIPPGAPASSRHRRQITTVGNHRGATFAGALPTLSGWHGDLDLLLDGHADQAAVFRPGAVVVADPLEAEQLVEHEPGVAGALSDAAVRDHVAIRRDPLGAIELAELFRVLERAVVADGLRPRDVRSAGYVAGTLGTFLRQRRGREQLPGELGGRANVDERPAGIDVAQDVIAEGALGEVRLGSRVRPAALQEARRWRQALAPKRIRGS